MSEKFSSGTKNPKETNIQKNGVGSGRKKMARKMAGISD